MKALDSISFPQMQKRLAMMAERATHLCGTMADQTPLSESVPAFLKNLITESAELNKPGSDKAKARAEFLARAQEDPKLCAQMCAIRVETYNNFILADQNILSFFYEIVNLKDDERPVAQNTTDQEIRVSYIGQDGEPEEVKVVRKDEEALIDLHYLMTKEIKYRKDDIYRGSVIDAALQTLRVSYDMSNQMEAKAFTLLTQSVANGGCFGDFTFTGTRPSRVYVPNSRINVSNLPATNDITVPGTGHGTKFDFRVFKAAKKYGDQWGKAFIEGPLYPTGRILIPSLDASDIADQIVPSGNTNNAVANELLEKGWTSIGYLGINWILVADNTLTPGQCYPEYSRKPGRIYLKPGLDKEGLSTNEYENDLKNEERRWLRKAFGAYINNATRINTCRLTYVN